MKHSYFTPTVTRRIASAFVELWKEDREMVLSKKTVQAVIHTIDPARNITSIKGDCPHVQGVIEDLCRKECNAIPAVLGAAGMLIKRNVDGSVAEKVSKPRGTNGNGAEHTNGNGAHKPTVFRDPSQIQLPNPEAGKRLKWDATERALLVRAWVEEFAAHPELGLSVDSFNKAMHKCLPQARWRKIGGVTNLAGEIFDGAAAGVRAIIAQGTGAAPVKVEVREVVVPYNVEKVLHDASLPRLAAVLAEREMVERQHFYANLSAMVPKGAVPAPTEKLTDAGVDKAHIMALLPTVRVVGFKKTQHDEMVSKFKDRPVRFLPSITPETMVEPSALFGKCDMTIVDTTANNGKVWYEFVVQQVPHEKREKVHGASRVLDHVKTFVGQWMSAHSDLVRQWRAVVAQQAASPAPQ